MKTAKKIQIKNKKDQNLSARLEFPADGEPMAYALFAHCFTCDKNLKSLKQLGRALTGSGLAVF